MVDEGDYENAAETHDTGARALLTMKPETRPDRLVNLNVNNLLVLFLLLYFWLASWVDHRLRLLVPGAVVGAASSTSQCPSYGDQSSTHLSMHLLFALSPFS